MSKLVNWGRWPVAALFATWGVALLWGTITDIPGFLRRSPNEVTYYVLSESALWIAALLCAWGIFRRRRWGRLLGIALCALNFATGALVYLLAREFDRGMALMTAIACSTLVWLLLPAVRAQYLQKESAA